MENRYYTPEIAEFHKGFQYESHGLLDATKDKWDTYVWDFNYTKDALELILEHGGIRVKYLDWEEVQRVELNMPTWANIRKLAASGDSGENKYKIEAYENNERKNVIVFQGAIKNTSVLRAILHQVGIMKNDKYRNSSPSSNKKK